MNKIHLSQDNKNKISVSIFFKLIYIRKNRLTESATEIALDWIELSDVSEKSYKSSELFSQETRPIVTLTN